jgi:long-subunit fatty acid transport protein
VSRRRLLSRATWCLVALAVAAPREARALSDAEVYRDFRFQFLDPGTRATALGGAFTALADDASAVYYNPAGLHFLSGPDAYVEYRSAEQDPRSFQSSTGSLAVDPVTGPVDLPFLEVNGGSEAETVEEVSFLSFAWPFAAGRRGRRLTVSASRQILFSTESTVGEAQAAGARFAFDTFPPVVVGTEVQVYSVETSVTADLSAEVIYWNGGVSYDVHPDLSLGLTVSYAELDLAASSLTTVTDPLELFADPTHPRLAGQPDQDLYGTSTDAGDSDFTFAIGVHWHPDSVFASGRSPWQLGAAFRQGARFSVQEEVTFNGLPDGTFENQFAVPDQYAVGVSYRTPIHWTFSVEYQRIEYGDLVAGFRPGVNFLTSSRLAQAAYAVDGSSGISYDVDDSDVPRAGAEFRHRFGGHPRHAFFVAAGVYRTEDAAIHLSGFNSADPQITEALVESFPEGEDVDHYTAGFGLTWGGFGFELAGETSDAGDQIGAALTYRFDRRARKAAP